MSNIKLVVSLILILCTLTGCTKEPTESYSTDAEMEPETISRGSVTSYYVSPRGDDNGPGTIDHPWATIQHAADTMAAGDTLFLREGVYNQTTVTENSGSQSDGYITFTAYPGEIPVLDGTGVSESQNGFIIRNNYIKLSGLEIQNWDENGIWIENSHHFEISDCKVHDVFYGIGVADGSHDFVLNRVEMYDFDLYGFDASASGGNPNYNGTINDSSAHSGRDRAQNVDGFALGHGDQHGFVFNRCSAFDVFDGFDISARDTTINQCIAQENWNAGFKFWSDDASLINSLSYHNEVTNVELDWDGIPGITTIFNCTLVESGTFNIWIENQDDSLHMYNSILAGGHLNGLTFEQISVTNYEGDYNIFHNNNEERAMVVGYEVEFSLEQIIDGEWSNYSEQDKHSIVVENAESLFENLNMWDLHLRPDSIAIDAGTHDGAPDMDFDGIIRPQGPGVDIGAFEFSN